MRPLIQTIDGIDCAWIGSDNAGCVAIFFTAGVGPVPQSSFIGEAHQSEIEERALFLPKTSECQLHMSYPRPDDLIEMAERGFYVFDWSDVHRTTANEKKTYQLVAEPSHPLMVADLPENLRSIATETHIKGVYFATSHTSGVHP